MITEISVTIQFWGNNFSPKSVEDATGINFDRKVEVGDIGDTGKYKGKPIPYGSASLDAPKYIKDDDKILWLANLLKGKIERMYDFGLEQAHFYIGYFYEDQCNCTLTREELKAISDLEIDFWFSCYDQSEDK